MSKRKQARSVPAASLFRSTPDKGLYCDQSMCQGDLLRKCAQSTGSGDELK
ncbi:hypothetical protein [Thalassoglobus polymorphus]|uniref:hypothetical protein n=1 Tax=Thalassoglobus polymorphus TaxID=2527994 RepID=UPI001E58365B|nr:hypothetical protein [Thalassoglobus polymorphus]